MDLLKSLFDSISQLFIKFLSYIPSGNSVDLTQEALTLQNIKGYLNWFIPFKKLAILFNAGCIIIVAVAVGLVLLKWAKQGFIKI